MQTLGDSERVDDPASCYFDSLNYLCLVCRDLLHLSICWRIKVFEAFHREDRQELMNIKMLLAVLAVCFGRIRRSYVPVML